MYVENRKIMVKISNMVGKFVVIVFKFSHRKGTETKSNVTKSHSRRTVRDGKHNILLHSIERFKRSYNYVQQKHNSCMCMLKIATMFKISNTVFKLATLFFNLATDRT